MDAQHHGAVPGLAAPELANCDEDDQLLTQVTAATQELVTPNSNEAPDAANVGVGLQRLMEYFLFDKAAKGGKPFATLGGLMALKGYIVEQKADGTIVATRWHLCGPQDDLDGIPTSLREAGT